VWLHPAAVAARDYDRKYQRITIGMAEEQVSDLMGRPPDKDGSRYALMGAYIPPVWYDQRAWLIGDRKEIRIKVKDGKVIQKEIWTEPEGWRPPEPSLLERIRTALGF